jgi:hypothetical protein
MRPRLHRPAAIAKSCHGSGVACGLVYPDEIRETFAKLRGRSIVSSMTWTQDAVRARPLRAGRDPGAAIFHPRQSPGAVLS